MSKLKRKTSVLCACLLAVTLVVGAAPARAEKVMRYAFLQAETGFDPAQILDLYSRNIAANIYDAPLRFGWLSGDLEANTLTAMPTSSADFKTWTFHLKPGIYFADDAAFGGTKRELVAADYVYSWKRLYDPKNKSPSYGSLQPYNIESVENLRNDAIKSGHFDYDKEVEGLKTLDRYTFQIVLGTAAPRFAADNLFDPSAYGAVAREVVEKYGDAITEHPVGTGPYMLTEWIRSSKMVLSKNPNYRVELFDAHAQPGDSDGAAIARQLHGRRMPFIDRIEVSIIEESQPRWLAFLNAEHDVIPQVPPDLAQLAMPNNKLAPNLAKKHLEARREVLLREQMVLFNLDDPIVGGYSPDKVALRRAIGLGIDVPRIIGQTQAFQAIPAQSIIYPHTYGYQPELRSELGEFDVAKANALLDIYGYLPHQGSTYRDLPDGKPLTIVYNSAPDQYMRSISEIVKRSMDAIGIRMVVKVAQWPQLLKEAQFGTYQMWFVGYSAGSHDPAGSMQNFFGPAKGSLNLTRFDMPRYNQLFSQQDATPDGPQRLAELDEMRDILIAYEPVKSAFHPIGISLAYPWVKGYRYDPLIPDWWRYVDVDEAAQRPYLK